MAVDIRLPTGFSFGHARSLPSTRRRRPWDPARCDSPPVGCRHGLGSPSRAPVPRCATSAPRARRPRCAGRDSCPACGAWNTLGPDTGSPGTTRPGTRGRGPPAQPLADVSTDAMHPLPTGVSELDRVMGGGVVAGSVTLLFGPPGIGKSTLLFQVLSSLAATGLDVMLASAEESLAQVRGRASRIGPGAPEPPGLEGPDVEAIEAAVERAPPGARGGRLAPVRLGPRAGPAGRQPGPGAHLRRAPDPHGQVERGARCSWSAT